jgi:drug/metabolite transporter (DMT)-like permease
MIRPSFTSVALIAAMLITGTLNTVSKKFQNDTEAVGLDGVLHYYRHPYAQTFLMFSGEALMMIAYFVVRWRHSRDAARKLTLQQARSEMRGAHSVGNPLLEDSFYGTINRDEKDALLIDPSDADNDDLLAGYSSSSSSSDEEEDDEVRYVAGDNNGKSSTIDDPYLANAPFSWRFFLPTVFDLIGTTMSGVGLLYLSSSVYQMLRGSIILFSGLLSVLFLRRKLRAFQWIGIAVVVVGLFCVGASSMLNGGDSSAGDSSAGMAVVGVLLVVAAQLFSAGQMIVEEAFLKGKNYPSMQVVGCEGCFGIVLSYFIVFPLTTFALPGQNYGHADDWFDAVAQTINSWPLAVLSLVYVLSIAGYNFASLSVAKRLTTVHRTLIDSSRTIFVWGLDLIIYYAGATQFGESWNHWSWLELLGFIVLLLGTLIYNRVIKLPGSYFDYSPVEKPPLMVGDRNETIWQQIKRCSCLL